MGSRERGDRIRQIGLLNYSKVLDGKSKRSRLSRLSEAIRVLLVLGGKEVNLL